MILACVVTNQPESENVTSYENALQDVAQFARALGSSNVRSLNLSTTKLGPQGMSVFLDNLPPSYISVLLMSTIFTEWEQENEIAVVQSIVRFLWDNERCRSIKRLSLLGNSFSRQANFLFQHVLLGSYNALYYSECKHTPETLFAQEPNCSLWRLDNHLNSNVSNDAIEYPSWMKYTLYPTIVRTPALESAQQRNYSMYKRMRNNATQLLAAARILGCRARYHHPQEFPFEKFPPELKLHVLRQLAPLLDFTQFERVLSWACCSETIGHCCKQRMDTRPKMLSTLEVPAWNWDQCVVRESHPVPINDDSVGDLAAFLEGTGIMFPTRYIDGH